MERPAADPAAPRPKSAKKHVLALMRMLSRARGTTRAALALAVLCVVKTAVSDYTGARALYLPASARTFSHHDLILPRH